MNISIRMIILVLATGLAASTIVAQEMQTKTTQGGVRTMRFSSDNAFILREIGAVITEDKGAMKVMVVPPKESRPKEMESVDLREGDEIGMAAGKRVKNLKELKDAYASAPVGEEFKIGIRREGVAHIVSFKKKDEKDLPHGGQMVIRQDGRGGDGNSDMFPAFGIGIEKKGTDITIAQVLPNAPKDIRAGDVVKTLNGKEIKSIADFNKEFDATKIGATLTLELLRDGKQVVVSAPRPEPKGQMIIKRN